MLVLDPARLRAQLALKGLTQAQLAYAIGMSQWDMSRMMKAHTPLLEGVAEAMAGYLGCVVTDFADTYVKTSDGG